MQKNSSRVPTASRPTSYASLWQIGLVPFLQRLQVHYTGSATVHRTAGALQFGAHLHIFLVYFSHFTGLDLL